MEKAFLKRNKTKENKKIKYILLWSS